MASRRRRRRGRRGLAAGLLAGLAAVVVLAAVVFAPSTPRRPWACVSAASLSTLRSWSVLLHRPIRCAVVFTDDAPNWQTWTNPWILGYRHNYPSLDWTDWYGGGHDGRHLVVTQNLIPTGLAGQDWLEQGSHGAYEGYARTLARNLVHAGMGHVVIRLAHEMNGNWYTDSIPDTRAGDAEWVAFWRDTVDAMRSVPGAHFVFDWNVNAGYRDIPLSDFYPGDRWVDVIGVDAYDAYTGPAHGNRVADVLAEGDGLNAVRSFARAHHRPLSIPEWGIGPAGQSGSVGDDPAYVAAIAGVVRSGHVLYQSIFTDGAEGATLAHAPRSLAVYRRNFG